MVWCAAMFAVRGAISVETNEREAIESAAAALVGALLARNALVPERVVSAVFTATPDLTAGFPAAGARRVGFSQVPMLCAQEIAVPGAPERIVRVMMHVDGARPQPIEHVYLGRAATLRPDLAEPAREPNERPS